MGSAAGSRPTGARASNRRIEDYLADVPAEGRPALRAELEALERELRRSDDTMARPDSTVPVEAPRSSAITEGPTIAPGPPPDLADHGEGGPFGPRRGQTAAPR